MIKYVYEAGETYDPLYDLLFSLKSLEEKLTHNKRLIKDERRLLLEALSIINSLEKY